MSAPLQKGNVLIGRYDKYAVQREIASGGVGTVFRAQKLSDKTQVAIKMLHGGRFEITDVSRMRFRAEIESAIAIEHPFLIRTVDHGHHNDEDFLVMEYLNGDTVANRIAKTDYGIDDAFRWIAQFLDGLKYLHESGFVHRDLKPNNLLLTDLMRLKIADLGILKDIGSRAYLTLSGDQLGSVLYISRHQRENPDDATVDDDAYSACCCIYEILSCSRIHVLPEHLLNVTPFEVPEFICDLVMGGLREGGSVDTLDRLRKCFDMNDAETCTLTSWASAPLRNQWMTVFEKESSANHGTLRDRFAANAPVILEAASKEMGIHHNISFAFLDASLIACTHGTSEVPHGAVFQVTDSSGLITVSEFEAPEMAGSVIVSKENRILCVGRNEIHLFQIDPTTFHSRLLHHCPTRDLSTSASVAKHPKLDVVLVARHEAPLQRIDFGEEIVAAEIGEVYIADHYYPKLVFASDNLFALTEEGSIILYRFSCESITEMGRIDFPQEILSLGALPRGGGLIVAHVDGLSVFGLSAPFPILWELPRPAKIVWDVAVSPDGEYLACRFGSFSDQHYVLLAGDGTVLMNYRFVPGADEHAGCPAAWSPCGKRLAIEQRNGVKILKTEGLSED